ncbi:putative Transposable element Tc1 transposase [Blattamonas nauphoetae]|uniref:Transposable element Tc1 transposase n=1 Tax=Blattamonas nauphoetae TaxID=2049346 RepID=A0ABQ9X330_9EUKA|nr:putative Transposable element Tc1 transposase [Blattamonas nauphoetae]
MNLSQRGAALSMFRKGEKIVDIARQLEIHRTTVQSFVSLHKHDPITDAALVDRHRSGRPRVTSARQNRLLVRTIRKDPTLQTDDVARSISGGEDELVSERTVRRRAAEAGMFHRVMRKSPCLTERQKHQRLEFVEAHLDWTDVEWGKVRFSDESSVQCGCNHGQKWVWRQEKEEWDEPNIQRTFKFPTTIKFWCCMSAQGPGTFNISDDSMTGDYYLSILQQYLVQNGTELVGVATKLTRLLAYREHVCNTKTTRCPIEYLKSVTREEWMGMDADYTKALVASMPARMQAGKRTHGGATRF